MSFVKWQKGERCLVMRHKAYLNVRHSYRYGFKQAYTTLDVHAWNPS